MTTPSLFDEPTQPPDAQLQRAKPRARMARTSDPVTSREAAEKVETTGQADADRKLILLVVRQQPGLTYDEIAAEAGLTPVAVGRRMAELEGTAKVKLNSPSFPALVRRGPARESRLTGGKCATWFPVEGAK